jgi:hypothetical protein
MFESEKKQRLFPHTSNYKKHNSSSEENQQFLSTQYFTAFTWNQKVHHSVHNSPPLASIPNQINLAHNPS